MNYTRTLFSDGTVLISDPEGKEILMKYYGDTARILHIDLQKELLGAAMKDAYDHGMTAVTYDYFDQLTARTTFFENEGFEIAKSKTVMSVDCQELFSSKGVIKSMGIPFPGVEWLPFRDMLPFRFEEMEDIFRENNIPLTALELKRFDEDLSGMILDEHRAPQALLLVSSQGVELVVEFIFGIVKNKPMYIMAALRGFAREIMSLDILDVYKKISMIEINDSVRPLITRLLDKKYSVVDEGQVLNARKAIAPEQTDSFILLESNEKQGSLEQKRLLPYQDNINWKMQWMVEND